MVNYLTAQASGNWIAIVIIVIILIPAIRTTRGRRLVWRTKGKGTKEKDGWSEASRAYCSY